MYIYVGLYAFVYTEPYLYNESLYRRNPFQKRYTNPSHISTPPHHYTRVCMPLPTFTLSITTLHQLCGAHSFSQCITEKKTFPNEYHIRILYPCYIRIDTQRIHHVGCMVYNIYTLYTYKHIWISYLPTYMYIFWHKCAHMFVYTYIVPYKHARFGEDFMGAI